MNQTNQVMQATVPSVTIKVKRQKREPLVIRLNRVNLREFIGKQEGKFVGIDFVKVDGSTRSLNGRLGVVQFLRGGKNKVESLDRAYLTMYDLQSKGYRTVNLSTVSCVRAAQDIYQVID